MKHLNKTKICQLYMLRLSQATAKPGFELWSLGLKFVILVHALYYLPSLCQMLFP